MKLFWVTTEDHDEDWFIVAETSEEAAGLHEYLEGYDPGEATAEEVMVIPENLACEKGWPSTDLILALGGRFLEKGHARVVELRGKVFAEGMLEDLIFEVTDNAFEKKGEGRPNKTKRSRRQ